MHQLPAIASPDLLEAFRVAGIGALRLDARLTLQWITPAAADALNLNAEDVGRPIADGDSCRQLLASKAGLAMESLRPLQDVIRVHDGRWFMSRALPQRMANGQADGLVITLADISEPKSTADAMLAECRARAAALEARVEERTRELGMLAGALSLAEDRERQAVAADLHDELAQLLSLVKLKLVGAIRSAEPGSRPDMEAIAGLVDTADARVRSLATRLGNPVLHQLGLVAALSALSDEMRRDYQLEVQLHDDGLEKDLEPPVGIIVYRAVRELLVNVAKHAGTRRSQVRCEVDCHTEGRTLVVVVSDDGRGFEQGKANRKERPGTGLGLPMIRERLRYIGGSFEIVTRPGAGVEATIMVPQNHPPPAAGLLP